MPRLPVCAAGPVSLAAAVSNCSGTAAATGAEGTCGGGVVAVRDASEGGREARGDGMGENESAGVWKGLAGGDCEGDEGGEANRLIGRVVGGLCTPA